MLKVASIRILVLGLVLTVCWHCFSLRAQSAAPPASPQDNPFPGEPAKTRSGGQSPVVQAAQPGSTPAAPGATTGKDSDNPFPGEDPNAPIIPMKPSGDFGQGSDSRTPSTSRAASGGEAAGLDGDPVRSPDGQARVTDDRFSSSLDGVKPSPEETDDARPGRSDKVKTREQEVKEDVDVGGFYLSVKNWKAAQARFSSAFALDGENPEAVWGLAEAERRLELYQESEEHYKLFLSYDPDGPHSREARKALDQLEAAHPSLSNATKSPAAEGIPPR